MFSHCSSISYCHIRGVCILPGGQIPDGCKHSQFNQNYDQSRVVARPASASPPSPASLRRPASAGQPSLKGVGDGCLAPAGGEGRGNGRRTRAWGRGTRDGGPASWGKGGTGKRRKGGGGGIRQCTGTEETGDAETGDSQDKVGIRGGGQGDGEVIRERILRSCEAHRRGSDSRGNERIGASNLDSIAAMGLQWR